MRLGRPVAVGRHGAWLVSRRLEDRPGVSLAYLQAALDAGVRVARVMLPPGTPAEMGVDLFARPP